MASPRVRSAMRRIATELGSGTTSLYRHVAGKDDLIDLMVDAVYGEVELPARPSGRWPTRGSSWPR